MVAGRIKLIEAIDRRADVPSEAFYAHWEGAHAELVRDLRIASGYAQSRPLDAVLTALPPLRKDGIAEVWFGDAAAARGLKDDPWYRDTVTRDGLLIVDPSSFFGLWALEYDLHGTLPPDGPRGLIFVAAGAIDDDRVAELAALVHEASAGASSIAYAQADRERYRSRPAPYAGMLEFSAPDGEQAARWWADAVDRGALELLASLCPPESCVALVVERRRVT
jgi:EthD domain-containing protein